jgi:hypothetical protein
MKKPIYILMALSMLLFVSCADEVDTENYFLSERRGSRSD